jgi:hypothetical protein
VATDEERVMLLLLNRLTNSVGSELRKQLISLTGVDRDEGSLGIRTRLKVEQVKKAKEDAEPTKLAKSHWLLPEKVLHELLSIVAEEAPTETGGIWATVDQLQALLQAYYPSDDQIEKSLLRKKPPKNDLTDPLVKRIAECDGFVRYEMVKKK